MDELIARLREESAALQKTAWSRMDGGQECSLSANLADEAATALEALRAERDALRGALEEWMFRYFWRAEGMHTEQARIHARTQITLASIEARKALGDSHD